MKSLQESLDGFSWENYHVISDELLKFDDHNIDNELMRQASTYSYYHALMSFAKKELSDAENEHTRITATLRRDHRLETKSKLTAKDLDDIVQSDEQLKEHQDLINKLEFRYELLKGLVRALEQKKDMLQQVSANKREETKLYK
jgi:cysteinyl-tRNA synthetase